MTPEEQDRLVADLETSLDRLQALYNQFFMGIEKLEPSVQRKEVERKIHLLRKEKLANTALRFRLQTQIQKYNTQSNYWKRICRQIEEGTYQRDVMRARKRNESRDLEGRASRALADLDDGFDRPTPLTDLSPRPALDIDDPFALDQPTSPAAARLSDQDKTPVPLVGSGIHKLHEKLIADARAASAEDGDELASFFQRRSLPPPPPPGAPPARKAAAPAASKTGGGIDEERMHAIYRNYVAARKKTGESTDGISFDKVAGLLSRQIASKEGIRDFKVVIRGGKAVIKTVKEG